MLAPRMKTLISPPRCTRPAALALGAGAALGLAAPVRAAESAPAVAWKPGRPVPTLSLPGHGGPGFSLAAAKGQPVLLNFWASWCEPCRSEMPSLELMAGRLERLGLRVVLVNFKETPAAIDRFLAVMPVDLPIVRDADGTAARAWGARVFPTSVLIGRDGRPIATWTGEVDWNAAAERERLAQMIRP